MSLDSSTLGDPHLRLHDEVREIVRKEPRGIVGVHLQARPSSRWTMIPTRRSAFRMNVTITDASSALATYRSRRHRCRVHRSQS